MPQAAVCLAGNGGGEAGVFDAAVLLALVGDEMAPGLELLDCFDTVARGIREGLLRAAGAGDGGETAMLAHSLKSSARAVGALRLGMLCARLEAQAEGAGAEELAPMVARVVDAVDAALAAMRGWQHAQGAAPPRETECVP